jgi:hypothetical protein
MIEHQTLPAVYHASGRTVIHPELDSQSLVQPLDRAGARRQIWAERQYVEFGVQEGAVISRNAGSFF